VTIVDREAKMGSAENPGRLIGVLLFLQLAGLIVPFVLLHPLTTGPQGHLANAAGASSAIKVAVFLLFANCTLTIGISIAAFRTFHRHSEAMALWLLAASVIMFLLQAVDNVYVLSMLSLSWEYARAGGPDDLFRALAAAVGSTRKWAHTTELAAIDAWIFLLHGILYRYALVPRPLAAFGLITAVLHFTGIPLQSFLGRGLVMPMGVPMAVSHLALAAWLVARGLGGGRAPLRAAGREGEPGRA
jgi:hypothetical protein